MLFFFNSCSNEPIQSDLSKLNNNIDTLLIRNVTGFNYQISPDIGYYNKLYIGSNGEFIFSGSLFNFSANGWETFLDSNVIIDSTFFKLFSGDSLIENFPGIKLHFSNDSIFDENSSIISNFNNIDFNEWDDLGNPTVDLVIDTSDTVSYFQETVLKWNIGSLIETIIDSSIAHRTFSISLESGNESFFEFFSREFSPGSLDPKIEIFYRKIFDSNSDSSTIDTLTRIVYVSQDISIIEVSEINNIDDGNIMLSRAKGSRAILNIPFNSLYLPKYTVIRSAYLHLYQPNDSIENFSVRMDPIDAFPDSISTMFDSDPYEDLAMYSNTGTVFQGKLEISLKEYLQSMLMNDSLVNAGFKLSSGANNDMFESVNFDLNNINNRLEIFYVSP